MRELIKARIMSVFNDRIGLESPAGKEPYATAYDNVRTPTTTDTAREIVLESRHMVFIHRG